MIHIEEHRDQLRVNQVLNDRLVRMVVVVAVMACRRLHCALRDNRARLEVMNLHRQQLSCRHRRRPLLIDGLQAVA
jgi:hypothetical protein